jgi:hypothetical protein
MSLTFGGNSVTGGNAGAVSGQPGIVVAPTASATTKVLLDNNTVSGTLGRAIIVNPLPASTSSAQLDATVTNNVVGTAAAGSGSSQAEALMARAGGNGHARFRIANNTLQHFAQVGMWLRAQEGSGGTGTADFTVTGNTVRNPDGSGFEGIYLSSGATAADNMTVCADLSTNTFAGTGTAGFTDLGVSKRFATTLRLPGYSGGSLQTYIQSRNPGGPTATNYSLTPDSYAGTCAAAVTP